MVGSRQDAEGPDSVWQGLAGAHNPDVVVGNCAVNIGKVNGLHVAGGTVRGRLGTARTGVIGSGGFTRRMAGQAVLVIGG